MSFLFEITETDNTELSSKVIGIIYTGITNIGTIRVKNIGDDTPSALYLTAACSTWSYSGARNSQGQEAVDEKWLEAKVGSGDWTPIGGATKLSLTPPTPDNYIDIQLRFNIPAIASTGGNFAIIPLVEYPAET